MFSENVFFFSHVWRILDQFYQSTCFLVFWQVFLFDSLIMTQPVTSGALFQSWEVNQSHLNLDLTAGYMLEFVNLFFLINIPGLLDHLQWISEIFHIVCIYMYIWHYWSQMETTAVLQLTSVSRWSLYCQLYAKHKEFC